MRAASNYVRATSGYFERLSYRARPLNYIPRIPISKLLSSSFLPLSLFAARNSFFGVFIALTFSRRQRKRERNNQHERERRAKKETEKSEKREKQKKNKGRVRDEEERKKSKKRGE